MNGVSTMDHLLGEDLSLFLCSVTIVNVKRIVDHPHIWGTDELMQKSPDGIFALEAISR